MTRRRPPSSAAARGAGDHVTVSPRSIVVLGQVRQFIRSQDCGSGGSGTLEEDGGYMGEVNVAVVAPVLGRDLSFVTDVDPRVRVFDANFTPGAPGGTGR